MFRFPLTFLRFSTIRDVCQRQVEIFFLLQVASLSRRRCQERTIDWLIDRERSQFLSAVKSVAYHAQLRKLDGGNCGSEEQRKPPSSPCGKVGSDRRELERERELTICVRQRSDLSERVCHGVEE